jgi:hypothetical protein
MAIDVNVSQHKGVDTLFNTKELVLGSPYTKRMLNCYHISLH